MNEEKMTLKESVRLTLRAWCFYWKNTPRLVRSVLLHWKSVEREQLNWQLGHDCFMEKQMSMD